MSSEPGGDAVGAACGRCAHFENDPAALERAFPGLASMGSGYASVRAQDGLCRRHDLYLSARDRCASFVAATGADNGRAAPRRL